MLKCTVGPRHAQKPSASCPTHVGRGVLLGSGNSIHPDWLLCQNASEVMSMMPTCLRDSKGGGDPKIKGRETSAPGWWGKGLLCKMLISGTIQTRIKGSQGTVGGHAICMRKWASAAERRSCRAVKLAPAHLKGPSWIRVCSSCSMVSCRVRCHPGAPWMAW